MVFICLPHSLVLQKGKEMTTTDIYALYILCCLLMTEVVAKIILMACKPVLWSEIKMIIDYVNRTNKPKVESAGDAVKAGICAALCVVVFGLLAAML